MLVALTPVFHPQQQSLNCTQFLRAEMDSVSWASGKHFETDAWSNILNYTLVLHLEALQFVYTTARVQSRVAGWGDRYISPCLLSSMWPGVLFGPGSYMLLLKLPVLCTLVCWFGLLGMTQLTIKETPNST